MKQLEDRGWIETIGQRETVGRPGLYATTRQFLDDLGLKSLDQLPSIEKMEGLEGAEQGGLLSLSEQIEFPMDAADAESTMQQPQEPQEPEEAQADAPVADDEPVSVEQKAPLEQL